MNESAVWQGWHDLSTLRESLGFDKYDLEANRRGKLTERQRRKIIKGGLVRVIGIGVLLVFFGAFLVVGIRDLGTNPTNIEIMRGVGFPLLLVSVTMLLILYHAIAAIHDAEEGKVVFVEGKPYLTFTLGRSPRHAILVDGIRLEVPKAAKDHIVIGYIYRVYYTPNTKTLLSMEKISNGEM